MEELKRTFRPEFLNRIDEIIVFHALNKEHLREIIGIMLARLKEELEERGVMIEFTDKAKDVLTDKGYDPDYGARPLRRAIQRLVENPLSEEMLKGAFEEGDVIVVEADEAGEELVFRKKELAKTAP